MARGSKVMGPTSACLELGNHEARWLKALLQGIPGNTSECIDNALWDATGYIDPDDSNVPRVDFSLLCKTCHPEA